MGNIVGADGLLDVRWNRAHFGAWCVVSSPLILGLDLDSPHLPDVIPFVTNAEAIAVNQQWAGNAGFLLSTTYASSSPAPPPAPSLGQHTGDPPPANHTPPDRFGFVRYAGQLNHGDQRTGFPRAPLRLANLSLAAAERWCAATAACACFTRPASNLTGLQLDDASAEAAAAAAAAVADSQPLPTRFEGGDDGRLLCASNGARARDADASWSTWVRASLAPADAEHGAQQVWAKPQPRGAWALLLVNSDATRPMVAAKIDLAMLPRFDEQQLRRQQTPRPNPRRRPAPAPSADSPPPAYAVRDVWRRADAPELAPIDGVFRPPHVPPRDSAFYVVSPTSASLRW